MTHPTSAHGNLSSNACTMVCVGAGGDTGDLVPGGAGALASVPHHTGAGASCLCSTQTQTGYTRY